MQSEMSHRRARGRGAYLIPSLFTMGNVFCGYIALMESFKAGQAMLQNPALASGHFDIAAKAIGFAVLFDGLDGRIARLMGAASPFGTELDSLADTITFGIAPALLAYSWGVQAVLLEPDSPTLSHLAAAGWWVCFIFVICSAARLARFNIQSSPGAPQPEHKHFVGLPTPAAAGLVAAIVHFNSGAPVTEWLWVPFWVLLLLASALLMVSTWRYYSFKHLNFQKQQKFVVVIGVGAVVGLIWLYSQVVLLLIASTYVLSGVIAKLSHTRRGRLETSAPQKIAGPHSEAL